MDFTISWMIAGGARLDDPDPRNLEHVMALREVKRGGIRNSSLTRLAERLGNPPARAALDPVTSCCAI